MDLSLQCIFVEKNAVPICRVYILMTACMAPLRGHLQTIFGKINVIVTLWGEGVIGHDV